jgi:hypothetical protein
VKALGSSSVVLSTLRFVAVDPRSRTPRGVGRGRPCAPSQRVGRFGRRHHLGDHPTRPLPYVVRTDGSPCPRTSSRPSRARPTTTLTAPDRRGFSAGTPEDSTTAINVMLDRLLVEEHGLRHRMGRQDRHVSTGRPHEPGRRLVGMDPRRRRLRAMPRPMGTTDLREQPWR